MNPFIIELVYPDGMITWADPSRDAQLARLASLLVHMPDIRIEHDDVLTPSATAVRPHVLIRLRVTALAPVIANTYGLDRQPNAGVKWSAT